MSLLIDNYEVATVESDVSRFGYMTSLRPIISYDVSPSSIINYSRRNSIINKRAYNLLLSIRKLVDNWDGDDAIAPPISVFTEALRVTQLISALGQKIEAVAPGPNGEIMLALKGKNGELELLLYPDRAKFVKLPVEGLPSQGPFALSQLFEHLKWLSA